MPANKSLAALFLFSLFLSSCLTAPLSTDPHPPEAYVFITSNPQATATPFLPSPNTETPIPSPIPPTLPPASATPSATPLPPTPSPLIPATSLPDTSHPQYAISALVDYANQTVAVSQVIRYPNQSSETLPSLVLAVNPNLWAGVFNLHNLTINGTPAEYDLQSHRLTLRLTPALPPGGVVEIGIAYHLNLPYSSTRHENFGYTWRQTNLIDWYPFVVPYAGNGAWILRDPHPYGENLVYPLADFRVHLTFADSTPPVVAASAPARYEDGAFVYDFPNARNFTLSFSPHFLVQTAEAGGITLYNYYFAEHASAATHALELTRQAVLTYQDIYGPYPHASLSIVETDLNDGLEADGLYFLAANFYDSYDGSVRNNLSVIAVHETAHQWWYGGVASDQALEPWLDEALCTYSERLFYEYNYPGALNWWWNFRIFYYNPTGFVDWRIYDTGSFRTYVNAVYFQGAKFLEALRSRMGDSAFFAFLADYYTRHRGHIVTADDFFSTLTAHTSITYADLMRTYFTYR
ncbi:MAG: M1 family metallopeptidase [Anaerolineales bacterium]|nr:M1 family metallopeptidase [Anaerolineales bacterium]MDW8278765.1 M1 family metallopeptidase [Anaerolineales bacterium]